MDNLTGIMAKIADGFVLPEGYEWTDADNEQRVHTSDTMRTLTTEILLWTSAIHDVCVETKKAIRSETVTTAEEVKAIETSVVWP